MDNEDAEMSDAPDSEGEGDSLDEEDQEDENEDAVNEDQPKDSDGKSLPRAANGKIKTKRGRNERVVAPEECRAHLRRLFRNERVICALLYGKHGCYAKLTSDELSEASADMFFLDVITVAPTRFRPPAKMNEVLFEHPQNDLLARVLNTSYRLRDFNDDLRAASQKGADYDEKKRQKVMEQLLATLIQLQVDVNSFMDSSKNPQVVRQGKLPPAGVKQGLEKKEGLFRKHMMVRVVLAQIRLSQTHMLAGKKSQLCCSFRHITGRQYRTKRNWCSSCVRQEAHVSRAGNARQLS